MTRKDNNMPRFFHLFIAQLLFVNTFNLLVHSTNSFIPSSKWNTPFLQRKFFSSSSSSSSSFSSSSSNTQTTSPTNTNTYTPASWDEISLQLDELTSSSSSHQTTNQQREPLLTLYRDTNGWCPFCERIWLALRIKNIPYTERLINLRDKPQWFLDMVPTGLVPAIMFYDDAMMERSSSSSGGSGSSSTRTIVWESLDILKALDESFPDTERLVMEDQEEYWEARYVTNNATKAGFDYMYGGRNASLTEEEMMRRKQQFETKLDELDDFLRQSDGPFFLGRNVTGIDVEIVPTLERWRYQLPLTHGIRLTENRPHLQSWYDAMDDFPPYADRVKGDEYSWTAVASTFLRLFGSGEDGPSPETIAAMERADRTAEQLTEQFTHTDDASTTPPATEVYLEAATKLITNHEAVVADCTRTDPLSQKEIRRASRAKNADLALRSVAEALLHQTEVATMPDFSGDGVKSAEDAAIALQTVAARLCVPRDMGEPAAKVMRRVLMGLAKRIEEDVKHHVALYKV